MLNIFLGNDCNFNCPYCLQPKGGRQTRKLDMERITAFITGKSITDIRFWGGEPLLYIDLIKEIVAGLEHRGIDVNMAMVTNGSLLNSDMVDFLNQKSIFTCLSYHAEMRLESLGFMAALESRGVNYLVTRQSLYLWDLINLQDRFADTFGQHIAALPIYVKATPACPPPFHLNPKAVGFHMDHLRLLHRTGLAPQILETLKGNWDQVAQRFKPGYARCMNPEHVSVDISGRILPCHYAQDTGDPEMGPGFIPDVDLIPGTQRYIHSKECGECEVLPYCQGGCHLSLTHETDCLLTRQLYTFLYKEIGR